MTHDLTAEPTFDPSLAAMLDRIEADVDRTDQWITSLRRTTRRLKEVRPSWETDDDEVARAIRRSDKIVTRYDANKHDTLFTMQEAAEYARCTRPDGRPQDSFYNAVKRLNDGNRRQRIWRSEVDEMIAKGTLGSEEAS
jgi:hypothetical protein